MAKAKKITVKTKVKKLVVTEDATELVLEKATLTSGQEELARQWLVDKDELTLELRCDQQKLFDGPDGKKAASGELS